MSQCCSEAQSGAASQVILGRFRRDPVGFLSCLVTTDETWIRVYDPETREQSNE
jgi:hypothetical protein